MVVPVLLGLQPEPIGDRGHAGERADELDVAPGELLVQAGELGPEGLDLELGGLGLEHGEIDRALSPPRHPVLPSGRPDGTVAPGRGSGGGASERRERDR